MNKVILASFLVFASFIVHAQDQKWSIEANYPLVANSNLQNDLNGVVDLGIKYRFANVGPVILGVGFNAAYLKNFDSFTYGGPGFQDQEFDYKAKQFLFQPKIFAEVAIPGLAKLKPQIGVGYAKVIDNVYLKDGVDVQTDDSNTDGGLNLNFGISYDLSDKFFIQVQYDFLNVHRKGENTRDNQTFTYDFNEKIGLIKAGVGFRF
ncbi:outer membrane protein [Maribacter stanieri]|uniref:outer membrane protein n=1 Tax=Maribacter stanieri TaxID=440514 RepID=UPI00249525AD|nr:outer membrane beta-barrel protein [Maribacter stanieri]|tara:strand:- start:177 stop:794 length:618 start_codon:yes stop_codon:yes gene_type:complete